MPRTTAVALFAVTMGRGGNRRGTAFGTLTTAMNVDEIVSVMELAIDLLVNVITVFVVVFVREERPEIVHGTVGCGQGRFSRGR